MASGQAGKVCKERERMGGGDTSQKKLREWAVTRPARAYPTTKGKAVTYEQNSAYNLSSESSLEISFYTGCILINLGSIYDDFFL